MAHEIDLRRTAALMQDLEQAHWSRWEKTGRNYSTSIVCCVTRNLRALSRLPSFSLAAVARSTWAQETNEKRHTWHGRKRALRCIARSTLVEKKHLQLGLGCFLSVSEVARCLSILAPTSASRAAARVTRKPSIDSSPLPRVTAASTSVDAVQLVFDCSFFRVGFFF